MKALILAAGVGERFRPHSLKIAKPAMPFLNVPLLYYSVELLRELDQIDELIINTYHLPETLNSIIAPLKSQFGVSISNERGELLGTAGALAPIREMLKDESNFLVCNADALVFPQERNLLAKLLDQHQKSRAIATLLLTEHPKLLKQFGAVWLDGKNQVVGFGKTSPNPSNPNLRPLHFSGVRILNRSVYDFLPEGPSDIFRDVLAGAIAAGRVVLGYQAKMDWYETGNLSDFLLATQGCLKQLCSRTENYFLTKTLKQWTPGFEGRLLCTPQRLGLMGRNCEVPNPDQQLKDFFVLGDQVILWPSAAVARSIIGAGLEISDSVVEEFRI